MAYPLRALIRTASKQVEKAKREYIKERGTAAYEYLNQVVEYFDVMTLKKRPQAEVANFCFKAVDKADEALRDVLAEFSDDVVAEVRVMVENGA